MILHPIGFNSKSSGSVPEPSFSYFSYDAATYELDDTLDSDRVAVINVPDADGVYQEVATTKVAYVSARHSGGVQYADDGTGTLLDPQPYALSAPASNNNCKGSTSFSASPLYWTGSSLFTLTEATSIIDGETAMRHYKPNTASTSRNQLVSFAATNHVVSAIIEQVDTPTFSMGVYNAGWDDFGLITYRFTEDNINVTGGTNYLVNYGKEILSQVGPNGGRVVRLWAEIDNSVVNGDFSFNIYVCAATAGYYTAVVHHAQVEPGSALTPPIVTVGASVSRDACALSFDDANHSDTSGAYYFEFKPSFATTDVSGDLELLSLNAGADLSYYDGTNGDFESADGTNTATQAQTLVAGSVYKIGIAYGSSALRVCVNGSWGTEQSYDGAFAAGSALELMNDLAVTGNMRDLRRYSGPYADAALVIDALMINYLTGDSYTDRLTDENGAEFTV